MPYFDLCRLKEHPALSDASPALLTHLANAACSAVENYCNRKFSLTDYDELFPGTGGRSLFLNQYPVTAIKAVRTGQQQAIAVQNSQSNIQGATVQVTATGVNLTITKDGGVTTATVSWLNYPTLGGVAGAINGLGNGWSATINGQFSAWNSSDLSVYQTTQSARQTTASLSPHYSYLTSYQLNPASGELFSPGGWRGFGLWSYRVQYTAGFETIPDEVIQATVELAASTFGASKADPNLVSETLGGYSYTRAATKSLADLSVQTFQTLKRYRKPTGLGFKAGS